MVDAFESRVAAITLPVHSSVSNLRSAAVYVLSIEWVSAGRVEGVNYPPTHQQNPGSALHRCLLFVPPSQTATHGDHRFVFCSAVLWNNLPSPIRTATPVQLFKTLLTIDRFKPAFSEFIEEDLFVDFF